MPEKKACILAMGIMAVLVLVLLVSEASADVQELIGSYNYDFYNGTINVTSQNDYMGDRDNNGKNDTLIINITTDAATTGTYNFIAEIIGENGILVNSTLKPITASDASADINFPSELLPKSKFNYSIRINDNSNNLIFRKFDIESNTYKNYETGINITRITDENANNNFLRVNLTINSSKATTANITATLAYNSSTISKTGEKTLSTGMQKVSIDFGNETIKSTHYNGNFTLINILIGDKIFDFNQNTSIYNYEDFAKTSYIKSISDGRADIDNNSLSDFLEINFTLEIKNAGSYTISYDLYDGFDNFVTNISKTEELNAGNRIIQTKINGSEIYKTKIDGPYSLSFAKLSIGNEMKDIIFDAYTTNSSFYTDYERPLLPDLMVTIGDIFNNTTNATNIIVNLSNIGTAPAFNIFLDIFDNGTYNNNATLAFLSNGDFKIYNFTADDASNASLFTAIADFDNLVDEIDESNNIANSLAATNDFDGDGISDDTDTLIGNADSVNTTINNLVIRIGNTTNLLAAFNGTHKIDFIENGTMLMEFDFNLSKVLNLSKIMIEKQSNSSFGYTLVYGLSLGGNTKTVYVDRVDNTINGVCIKDAEVTSISQMNDGCNGADEAEVECDSTLQGAYTCEYNSTTNKYKVTGLNNSGIKQVDYVKPETSAVLTSLSGIDGAGGSSGSGSSGSCLEKWQCGLWSNCINNLQTRTCAEINNCGTIFNRPIETKQCQISDESIKTRLIGKNYENNGKLKNKYSLPGITGFLSGPPENTNLGIGTLIASVVVIAGLFGYFYFFYKSD